MKLVKVGKRVVNLEYLILAEEWDGTPDTGQLAPGDVRITLETGRTIDLRNGDAALFMKFLEDEVMRPPHEPGVAFGVACDPVTGEPLVNSAGRESSG
jgi:hypothetical protein